MAKLTHQMPSMAVEVNGIVMCCHRNGLKRRGSNFMSFNLNQEARPFRLSVVMMVKNEAKNLAISLPALKGWIDELIVLDSGSSWIIRTFIKISG